MATLVSVTSTPIPGQITRKPCFTFRPKLAHELNVLKIEYGTGCSATVRTREIYFFTEIE